MAAKTALQLLHATRRFSGTNTSIDGEISNEDFDSLNVQYSEQMSRFLSCGCPILDRTLGGIPSQGITEISGEAGCGKTQICLCLVMQAQLSLERGGLEGAAAYLSCGEGQFPIRRLSQLATYYETRTGIEQQALLSNIHIEHCHNSDDALDILRRRVPELCHEKKVKLLVIDSLAGLLRFEFDSRSASEMRQRTALLFQIAQELKLISDIFGTAIVVVNQVKAADFDDIKTSQGIAARGAHNSDSCSSSSNTSGSNKNAPALGLAWSHCINTRIRLLRDTSHLRGSMMNDEADVYAAVTATTTAAPDTMDRRDGDPRDSSADKENLLYSNTALPIQQPWSHSSSSHGSMRQLVLEFSPVFPSRSCGFFVDEAGVHGM